MLIIALICVLVISGLVGLAIYLKKSRNGHSQGRRSEQVYQNWSRKERHPELTSVYDTLLLHRMAASRDVDTA
ncbi:hypothetical protein J4Q44_G00043440 [Coregonus suidteri]|uniref:Uncharacterized protein n=1 Tax=Coregonus suidteri TaxID=861788 RepID=A0AAN8ME60_9TELE